MGYPCTQSLSRVCYGNHGRKICLHQIIIQNSVNSIFRMSDKWRNSQGVIRFGLRKQWVCLQSQAGSDLVLSLRSTRSPESLWQRGIRNPNRSACWSEPEEQSHAVHFHMVSEIVECPFKLGLAGLQAYWRYVVTGMPCPRPLPLCFGWLWRSRRRTSLEECVKTRSKWIQGRQPHLNINF